MRVAVIGVGYVGLVQAAVLADVGNRVTCVDINQARIDNLRQGIVGIYEPDLDALVRKMCRIIICTSPPTSPKPSRTATLFLSP